jgi:predicted CXXCH cytochrome family protein
MWQLMLFMLVGAAVEKPGAAPPAAAGPSTCVQCHLEQDGAIQLPAKLAAQDIHFKNGLSCHNCHGGDPTLGIDKGGPEDSMSRAKGYIGRPDRNAIAKLCASCHSNLDYMRRYNPKARVDQYTEYLTSVHGRKYQAGDKNVATCVDCHGAHGVKAVGDATSPTYPTNVAGTCARCHADKKLMEPYGIPTDQLQLYSASVHGDALMNKRDLSAPTCNSCHGNHGAAPPGVDSVANVCGQCHVSQWDLFNQSPHKKAFAENQMPACATCHEHHGIKKTSDAMLGTEQSATCASCHEQGSKGYIAAAAMKSGVAGLRDHLAQSLQLLKQAERDGMEVSRPLYDLSEGRDRLVLARVQVHRFDPAALNSILGEGEKIARDTEQSGWKALGDFAYRRKGLAVSVVILLFMIGLLLLKIRQISRSS